MPCENCGLTVGLKPRFNYRVPPRPCHVAAIPVSELSATTASEFAFNNSKTRPHRFWQNGLSLKLTYDSCGGWIVCCGHESDSRLLPHQATRPALAAGELDENSERGLSGAHWQRESRRAAMALAAEQREQAAPT